MPLARSFESEVAVLLFGAPEAILFRGTHLLFALVLVFLLYRRTGETGEAPPTIFDYALLALGAWADLRATITERWLRAPKASFVYSLRR